MRRIALLAAILLAVPAAAAAQSHLVLGVGMSTPAGDFGDQVEAGFHGRVGLQVGVPAFPLSARAEGEVHRFAEKGGSDNTTMMDGTLSLVLSLGGIGISPYVLAGVGQYRIDSSTADATSDNGIHGGFGVSFGLLGVGGYAELRVVSISTEGSSSRYIPVTVGLRF